MMGVADGPTEVHKAQVATTVLKSIESYEGLFPPDHILPRLEAVRTKYADILSAMGQAAIP